MTHIRRAASPPRSFPLAGGAAFAHVTLETEGTPGLHLQGRPAGQATAARSKPTTAIRVKIPEGVIAAKPMPKPGWRLTTVKGEVREDLRLLRHAAGRGRD